MFNHRFIQWYPLLDYSKMFIISLIVFFSPPLFHFLVYFTLILFFFSSFLPLFFFTFFLLRNGKMGMGVVAWGREEKLSSDKFESSKIILVIHCLGRIHIDV